MTIIIDNNEPPELRAHVMDKGGDMDKEDLSTGDILVNGFMIERKEYNDFVGRLTTDTISIWRQLDAMIEACDEGWYEPMLLLEGSQDRIHSNIKPAAISGALARVTDKGVSMVPTPDIEMTAQYLVTLDNDSSHSVESVRQSPSIKEQERPQHIVEGLPGVGPERAVDLLDHFGAVCHIINATPEELQEVSGIGHTTAVNIREACGWREN